MAAVRAFPNHVAVLGEHKVIFHVRQQAAIAFLMRLLDGGDHAEFMRNRRETLGVRFLCHADVHVCPLGVLALSGVQQVRRGILDFAALQQLEPHFGVFLLVRRGCFEQFGNLHIAVLACLRCEVGVLIARHRFSREGFQQVLFGFCALKFLSHGKNPPNRWFNVHFAEVCWNHYTTKLRILKRDFCLRKGEIPALHAHIAYKYESKVN